MRRLGGRVQARSAASPNGVHDGVAAGRTEDPGNGLDDGTHSRYGRHPRPLRDADDRHEACAVQRRCEAGRKRDVAFTLQPAVARELEYLDEALEEAVAAAQWYVERGATAAAVTCFAAFPSASSIA